MATPSAGDWSTPNRQHQEMKREKVNQMPAGDRSGPKGMGPGTGRGRGYCSGWVAPGWANPAPGRGYYIRGGHGMRARGYGGSAPGWRRGYLATGLPSRAHGPMLKDEAEWLNEQQAVQAQVGPAPAAGRGQRIDLRRHAWRRMLRQQL